MKGFQTVEHKGRTYRVYPGGRVCTVGVWNGALRERDLTVDSQLKRDLRAMAARDGGK